MKIGQRLTATGRPPPGHPTTSGDPGGAARGRRSRTAGLAPAELGPSVRRTGARVVFLRFLQEKRPETGGVARVGGGVWRARGGTRGRSRSNGRIQLCGVLGPLGSASLASQDEVKYPQGFEGIPGPREIPIR